VDNPVAFERTEPLLDHGNNPEDWDPMSEWCGWGCMICGRVLPPQRAGRPRKMCGKARCNNIYKRKMQRLYRKEKS
jgi:hypothetical protein